MKKKLLTLSIIIASALAIKAQTNATNFNCNDCTGANHDLFTELNSGKVIVMAFVMPCVSCIGPAKTAYNVAQSYATSNPGQVLMYVVDDYANTNCTSLNSWVTTNAMPNTTKFSDASILMSDYGSAGMPKIVVLGGGTAHTIFFNQNGSAAGNSAALQTAINAALASLTTITDKSAEFSALNLYPNPANDVATISFNLEKTSVVNAEVYSITGKKILNVYTGTLAKGKNTLAINTAELTQGVYFVRIGNADRSEVIKLFVSR